MKSIAELTPMFLPMVMWLAISLVAGLAQVWMGASKCRRRSGDAPAEPWSKCIAVSLADGNLFIFSIGTAGGVLAITVMELWRNEGPLLHYRLVGFILLIVSIIIIFLASNAWTDAKSAQTSRQLRTRHGKLDLTHIAHSLIGPRDIVNSVRYASLAFTCALLTEGLRLMEALKLLH